jgi:hypothetical protein
MAVTEENPIGIQTLSQFGENRIDSARKVELRGASLDDYVKWSRADGGITDITHREIQVSSRSQHRRINVMLDAFRIQFE